MQQEQSKKNVTLSLDPTRFYRMGSLVYKDDFNDASLKNWVVEQEPGGNVAIGKETLSIDVAGGCTVWLRPELVGPVAIEYEASVIMKDGPHDRLSDLNCFWMAQDPQHIGRLLQTQRSGKFADYDALTTYYVGQGGNRNTTTRYRRYIGKPGDRPLLPEHDLHTPEFLLRPNVRQKIRLIACGKYIQYWRDDRLIFNVVDPKPYTRGWFGFRTVSSHLEISHFRVYRLNPIAAAV